MSYLKRKNSLCLILMLPLTLLLLFPACDNYLDSQLEYADFLLDKADFTNAIVVLNILDGMYPDNREVKSRLASAHLSHAILDENTTYLSLVAEYFDVDPDLTGDENKVFKQFSRRSPDLTDDDITELALARVILDEQISDSDKRPGEWLQLAFARLMEINAIGVVKTGALSPDQVCNAEPTNPAKGPEGLPDDFDSSALTPEEEAQFSENVAQVPSDFQNAGLSSDMSIIRTTQTIADELALYGDLASYLDDQFGVGAVCPDI